MYFDLLCLYIFSLYVFFRQVDLFKFCISVVGIVLINKRRRRNVYVIDGKRIFTQKVSY